MQRFNVTITYQVDVEDMDEACTMAYHDAAVAGNVVNGFCSVNGVESEDIEREEEDIERGDGDE